jgi:SPP1 gp7 family putative phage head morphogenesis protein
MALTDEIADTLTEQDMDIMRVGGGRRRKMVQELNALMGELIALLRSESLDPTAVTRTRDVRNRIDKLSKEVGLKVREAYSGLHRATKKELELLVTFDANGLVGGANFAADVSLFSGTINATQAREIVNTTTMQGQTLGKWFQANANDYANRVVLQVNEGVKANETINQITTRVRRTAIPSIRNAVTLTDTASAAVINQERLELYQQNAEVVKAVQAINPLDSRTSDICRARAGRVWRLDDPGFPGPPPWHFNCRTTLVPITYSGNSLKRVKGKAKLKRELKDLTGGEIKEINGAPAKNVTFESFLNKRSVAQQKEILGPGKYKLWKDGDINMRDLIDQTGRPLTLEQLRAKHQ